MSHVWVVVRHGCAYKGASSSPSSPSSTAFNAVGSAHIVVPVVFASDPAHLEAVVGMDTRCEFWAAVSRPLGGDLGGLVREDE
ncbi:hypothetical protein PG996_000202 [Apiospora saccharicola]|uniref:Uncharacterized protein n=1 Tax=Apiospora saccharicola TaxID=335842 RepID=A0ABR1WD28_9PEZI